MVSQSDYYLTKDEMMNDTLQAVEFIGGPVDGLQQIIDGRPEVFSFVDERTQREYLYAWRRYHGQRVVSDEGIALFDYERIL